MNHEQELNEAQRETVKPHERSTRPQRYEVAARCRTRLDRFLRSVLARRLRGTPLSVRDALAVALTSELDGPPTGKCIAALAGAGITVYKAGVAEAVENSAHHIEIDPRVLRAAYPASARLEPHTFIFRLALKDVALREAECIGEDVDFVHSEQGRTRYIGGICDRDELRMQVEVLRQPLGDLGITIDEGLDELCAGLQNPREEVRAHCNNIVLALDCCGLRFHSAKRSWRLPRAGLLVIEQPDALIRSYPALAFFEPIRFGGLAIVDRPARAGSEVRQGLLF